MWAIAQITSSFSSAVYNIFIGKFGDECLINIIGFSEIPNRISG
ncbi:MAG TPA: hypothetical protein DEB17_01055 [Chlorobaculum sp.]|nr:hypothetical protein [Chlorobaculum sp.]